MYKSMFFPNFGFKKNLDPIATCWTWFFAENWNCKISIHVFLIKMYIYIYIYMYPPCNENNPLKRQLGRRLSLKGHGAIPAICWEGQCTGFGFTHETLCLIFCFFVWLCSFGYIICIYSHWIFLVVFHPRVPPAPKKWPALLLSFAAGFLFSIHAANALNTIKCGTKRYVCICANNPAPSSLYTNISRFRSLSLSL